MKTTKALVLAVLLTVVLVLVACSGGGSGDESTPGTGYGTGDTGTGQDGGTETPAEATVVESGLSFSPASIEVAVGDTVTFTNDESAPHNVSIGGTELGTQAQGQSVTWTATEPGTFPFICTIHPSMTGEVIVK